jgi:hypothetical protein
MDSELRQRGFLAVRVVAVLLSVAVLLLLATRSGGQKDTVASKTTPAPNATHATAKATAKAAPVATPRAVQVTAGQTLCQAVPRLDTLSLQTLNPPAPSGAINISNAVIVTKLPAVEAIARQLCALPPLGANPKFCLASRGVTWLQLIFGNVTGGHWTVWTINGGCMQVIGVGNQTLTAVPDKRLWPTALADLSVGRPLTS